MRFTPPARELFNVIALDVGRPLLDITHRLDYSASSRRRRRASSRRCAIVEREVHGRRRALAYLMRILPYRTTEDRIDGAVLTFVDITATQGKRGAAAPQRAALPGDHRQHPRLRDHHDRPRRAASTAGTPAPQRLFGYSEAEIVGPADRRAVRAGGPRDRRAEQERDTARERGHAADERWHLRKDGSRFYCSGVLAPLTDGAFTATSRSRAT